MSAAGGWNGRRSRRPECPRSGFRRDRDGKAGASLLHDLPRRTRRDPWRLAPALAGNASADCRKEIERLNEEEKTLVGRLAGIALRADVLKAQVTAALNDARYLENMGTLHAEEYLFGLQGWVPAGIAADLLKQVEAQRLPLQVEVREPLPGEEPPILYENNWFIRRIEPLLKLYGNPKYRNLDPSYFFAPFMILFFGVCLGDAGYGVVFYLVAHAIGRKWGEQVEGLPLVIKLCKAFAVSAVFIGIITGSVFGYNFENRDWILLDVAVGVGDPMLFFYLALGLGVLHLSFSYLMGMMQAGSWPQRFPKLGLLCVLWGGVLLVSRNIWFAAPAAAMNQPLTWAGFSALALGVLLTLLFASDHKNWGSAAGARDLEHLRPDGPHRRSPLLRPSVRSRNRDLGHRLGHEPARGHGPGAVRPIVGIPFAIIIMILGHTFNLALSILGSTVHSVRLHFVEAFKSFFEGAG